MKLPARIVCLALGLAARSAAASPSATVEAPITAVTVYSDRARVTRTATVSVAGSSRVELPLLGEAVDVASIRVEASGAEVTRVDIAHVDDGQLPVDEARALLAEMEKLDDRMALSRGERDLNAQLASFVAQLRPATPMGDPLRAPPRLNASGWPLVLAFQAALARRMKARVRTLDTALVELGQRRERLVETARLLGGVQRRHGQRVWAHLTGNGSARLTLSYLVGGARWYPSYDIQLLPEKGQVEVAFAGEVSQQTGEDWNDAALTLSTAVPSTSIEYPRLLSWKLGAGRSSPD